MPDSKISELNELAAGNVANDDELAIVDTDAVETKRWTWASIKSDILSWLGFTATEASYLSGVTSAIQTQIDGKADSSHTHTLTDITDSGALAALDTVGTAEIDNDAVTFDKIANIATNRVLARSSAGSGSVEALTLPNFRTLINVEDGADVTDTTNVTAAGALMDSEVTDLAGIKSLDTSTLQVKPTEGAFVDGDKTKLDGIETGADVTDETNVVSALSGATLTDAGTPQATDKVLVQDSSDSDNLKYVDFSDFSSGTTVDVVSNVAQDRILGRVTAGSGDSEELTATQVRTLINVEDGATADQTAAEIKTAYESNADTNAFTDAEKTKLSGIATGAEVNTVDSVNTQTGAVVLDADDIDDTSTAHKFVSLAQRNKLDGIEAGADVTDETNVVSALSGATLSDAGTPQATDKVLVQDASDSDNLKYVDFSDFSSGTTVDVVSNVAADRILGRVTAGSGDSEELTAAQVRSLINVEDGATADQTGAEIKAAYEGEADTNAYTDAEKSKLAGISAGAEVNAVDSVNSQTGAVVLDADDIDDTSTTNKFATSAELSKLAGIETGADVTDTANVTAAGALMDSEVTDLAGIKALDTSTLQVKPAEGAFVDGDKTKLDGIETGADVTDTANVTAAGALMDSEVDADIKTLSLPANTTISTFGASLVDDADASAARTTLGLGTLATDSAIDVAIGIACSDETTALTTGSAKVTFRMPYAMTLTDVRASLTGAGSTSGTTTIDINESGSTILSTKLTIDQGEKTSETAATAAVISDSALADDAEITIDIDAVTGGADETGLKVWLIGTRSV